MNLHESIPRCRRRERANNQHTAHSIAQLTLLTLFCALSNHTPLVGWCCCRFGLCVWNFWFSHFRSRVRVCECSKSYDWWIRMAGTSKYFYDRFEGTGMDISPGWSACLFVWRGLLGQTTVAEPEIWSRKKNHKGNLIMLLILGPVVRIWTQLCVPVRWTVKHKHTCAFTC